MKVNKGKKSGEITNKPVKDGKFICENCKRNFKKVKVVKFKHYCEDCFNKLF